MRKYDTLLFDADMTLFDFEEAERISFAAVMAAEGIACTPSDFLRYHRINADLWSRFGRGEITKDFLQAERFTAFLATIDAKYTREDGIRANGRFVAGLSACSVLLDGAEALCRELAKTHTLYIVTNGISRVQHARFEKSPLTPYFADVFVSEDAGEPKPGAGYFNYVFGKIGEEKRPRAVIIGDSLESDIRGGEVAGIDSVWYNPGRKPNDTDIRPTAEAADYGTLYKILTQEL